jgi:hypothetical protein
MAEQAGESVRDFLHFCAAKCMTAGEPDLAPAGGFASDDLDSVYEAYQDASEALLPEVAVAGPAAQLSGEPPCTNLSLERLRNLLCAYLQGAPASSGEAQAIYMRRDAVC